MIIDISDLEPISLNAFYSCMHWSKRKKIADTWHTYIKYKCKELKIKPIKKCKLIFDFKNNFDIDNNAVMIKMTIDGMVCAGVLPDDNKDHVKEILIRESNKNRVVIYEL